ncbi:MAG: replicative DNA helicase [Candidatus Hydrogenedentota bacterium]
MEDIAQVLPHDIEAEKSFIQAILTEPELITYYIDKLKLDDFYRESHRVIYQAMIDLFQNNRPIDLITLKDVLISKNAVEAAGGIDYILSLFDGVGIPANAYTYVEIIKQKSLRRKLIQVSDEMAKMGYDQGQEIKEIIDKSEQRIFEIVQDKIDKGLVPLSKIIDEKLPGVIQRIEIGEGITGVSSGYAKIDEMTAGFQKSDLIIVAARPGMGKTAFVLNVAMRATGILPRSGEKAGEGEEKIYSIAMFSLEMPAEQLMMRMLSRLSGINLHLLRTAKIDKRLLAMIGIKQIALRKAPIYIDDKPQLNVVDIKAKLRRLIQEVGKIDLVTVDYLQLMSSIQKYQNKVQEVSEISLGLKQIAREFEIPLIAVSQLSRAPEKRSTKDMMPQLSDLRESGSIEQDADMVMFIYRPEIYFPKKPEYSGLAEINIAKQRNGPTGIVSLSFVKHLASFEDLALEGPAE